MIHLRAKNLVKNGVLSQWIYQSPYIKQGDEIAVITHDDGTKSKVKTGYSGVLVKTLKLGSKVVNGTALANLASDESEIKAYNNWREKSESSNVVSDVKKNLNVSSQNDQKDNTQILNNTVSNLNQNSQNDNLVVQKPITGNNLNTNGLKTAFSGGTNITEQTGGSSQSPADRIAWLKKSRGIGGIEENIPPKSVYQPPARGDMSPPEASNIFQKRDNGGPSEFKKIIEARKKELLAKEQFKEVEEKHVDAMSRVDDRGRPLIMRNIIASRKEKIDAAGGDASAVNFDRVATKQNNAAFNNMGDNKMAGNIKGGSVPVDYNLYKEEEDSFAIVNSPTGYYTTQYPDTKLPANRLMQKAKSNPNSLSYHERKMLRFYDEDLRKEKLANTPNIKNLDSWKQSGGFWKNKLPYVFTREVNYTDPMTGESKTARYIDTPKGKSDYEIYTETGKLPEVDEIGIGELSSMNRKAEEQISSGYGNDAVKYLKDEVSSLKAQLERKNKLDEATDAIKRNFAPNSNIGGSNNSNDAFSQLMQYMIMQNIISGLGNSNQPQAPVYSQQAPNYYQVPPAPYPGYQAQPSEMTLKRIIKEELKNFSSEIDPSSYSRLNPGVRVNESYKMSERELDGNLTNGYVQFEPRTTPRDVERTQINKNRDSVVKSMIMSQNYIPPLTISIEIDMSDVIKLKTQLKKSAPDVKFPSMSFIVKAISAALSEYPRLNSTYDPETNELIVKKFHNIGIATETSEGLVIPVLKYVEKLSVKEIAIDITEMTLRLRRGKLFDYEMEGNTIAIANYGTVGAIQATPTIFYPNTAVVGIGKIVKKPVVIDNQNIAIKAVMNMTLTVDQRTIEASEAGNFLNRVKNLLENPQLLTLS